MSEDGGVMSSQETDHVSPTEVTPELGKEALDTWRPSRSGEAVGKPGVEGVYTNQRLNLSKLWEGSRRTCQGLKPASGNPTVRHFRGASRNVRHGETVNPPAIERAGPETPHLQRGALDLYPNGAADKAGSLAGCKTLYRQLPGFGRLAYPVRAEATKHDVPGRRSPGCPAGVFAAVGTTWGASKLGGRNIMKYLHPRKLRCEKS